MLIPHILKTFKNLQTTALSSERSKKSSRLNKNKILLVGMADSPHFQKWLRILQKEFPDKKILVLVISASLYSELDKLRIFFLL